MERKNYLNAIFNNVNKNGKDAAYFAYYIKNIRNFQSMEQGKAVEEFISAISGYQIIAEDGVAISEVGHKGDIVVEYENKLIFPNVKSTMTQNFMGTSGKSRNGIVKVFDSSRTRYFVLSEKIKQIGGDLPIIHMTWDKTLCRGYIAVTSLGECAEYFYGDDSIDNIVRLFNTNNSGHYLISAKNLYLPAKNNGRVTYFKITPRDKALFNSVIFEEHNIMNEFEDFKEQAFS